MLVKLLREHYEQIVKQAKAEFPLECCGLLAGSKSASEIVINKVYPLRNVDQSSEHFSIDPKEQFAAIKKMRAEGQTMVGNYHSHPFTPSRPSDEDKRLAYDQSMLYAILSLKEDEPVLNFFKIQDHQSVEKLEHLILSETAEKEAN